VNLHDLRPAPGAKHRRKRVGRGESSGKGKTSGRGMKGTKARNKVPLWFEGGQMPLQRRVPKWGGFTNPNRIEYAVVNLGRIDDSFEPGEVVTPQALTERRLVRKGLRVKVLARGELTKALTVRAHHFSKQADEKIRSAGGAAEVIEPGVK
jgi:large subunit ribosomal protein L15